MLIINGVGSGGGGSHKAKLSATAEALLLDYYRAYAGTLIPARTRPAPDDVKALVAAGLLHFSKAKGGRLALTPDGVVRGRRMAGSGPGVLLA